jgi:Holliday junction DNA helicase RuvB
LTGRGRDGKPGPTRRFARKRLSEFIGQKAVVSNLETYNRRGEGAGRARSTTSCCLGLPGSGRPRSRTSSPTRWGVGIRTTSGPAIERKGDIAAILTALEPGDVLFIDEIHRLSRVVEELL